MKVIINGDDLGYSEKENNAIFSYLDRRIITSATIMSNAPGFEQAVQTILLYQKEKNISFGVHLNLTEFSPIKNSDVFEDANFFRWTESPPIFNNIQIKKLRQASLEECKAQIDKVLDHGIHISHFDSHNHFHTHPFMLFILKELINIYHINKWRITKNFYVPPYQCSIKKKILKTLWNANLRYLCSAKTTDYFGSFMQFVQNRKRFIKDTATIELGVHPGKDWTIEESKLLESDWIKQVPYQVNLISYNDL
jgi:predicted glycoside hydrolase/deacetylase ChbG (UPF0249 family)